MTQDGEPHRSTMGLSQALARAFGAEKTARASERRAWCASVAALAAAAALACAGDARAAAFEVNDTGWEGGSEMLQIAETELGAARVSPVAVLDWSEVQPEDGVLVIAPQRAMDPDDTAAFMKAGGRLAILDDYGHGDETLTRFHIDRIPAPTRPINALRNRAAFAIAEPVVDVVAGHATGPHPVVAHVQWLVTNHPTGLRHPNLSPVLRIRAIGEPDVVIAVAGLVGKGRLFAMSDPSATINEMLRYPGNRAFVAGLVRYLVDDDGGQRRQGRLWIVTNHFTEEGSFGGKGSSVFKDLLSQLKAIGAAFAEARRDGFPSSAHVAIAALCALGLAGWVARSSARPYRGPLPRYARRTPLVAQGGIAGRFAVIAAPTSPRSLAVLELKSALFEGVQDKFGLPAEPAPEALLDRVRRAGRLDESAYSALKEVLRLMQEVETAVLAGRPVRVSESAVEKAAAAVRATLDACAPPPAGALDPAVPRS